MLVGLERIDVDVADLAAFAQHHLDARRTAHDHRILRNHRAVRQFVGVEHVDHLVAVARVDEVRRPLHGTEVLVQLGRHLDALVVHAAGVDVEAAVGRCR